MQINLINETKSLKKPKKLKTIPTCYVIADIETTGFRADYNSIIEISALKVENNKVIAEFSKLIKQDKHIPTFISNLTGITDEMVKDKEKTEDVISSFYDFLQDYPIVGHNIKFDLSFLNYNLIKYHNKIINNDYFDTLYFSRKVYKDIKSHKLTNLAQHLNISTENAHRALSDCYMTYYLMLDMQKKLSPLN